MWKMLILITLWIGGHSPDEPGKSQIMEQSYSDLAACMIDQQDIIYELDQTGDWLFDFEAAKEETFTHGMYVVSRLNPDLKMEFGCVREFTQEVMN